MANRKKPVEPAPLTRSDGTLILDEASQVVNGARRWDYGTPAVNHSRTAEFWTTYLGLPISPEQVCVMNILQKVSRSVQQMTRDTLVDIAGYAQNIELIEAYPDKQE